MGKEVTPPVDPSRYDRTYFLTSCEGYTEFVDSEGANLSRRLKQAFEVAEVAPGMTVLDVGCGRGEVMRRCADLGARACGIDYAPVAVQMAHGLGSTSAVDPSQLFGIFQADAKRVPFSDGVFDRVLMFDLVEHLWPWELKQAIAEAKRVLRPD
ncbi:MAG: methyltransferase domain-containing protein, partial [Anaerolineae bacterium]|nr:methyltransferase domain-containing protein [Anaerolineae bacterium]